MHSVLENSIKNKQLQALRNVIQGLRVFIFPRFVTVLL